MSLDERPRSSARPAPREHYNSLPRTSIEGALDSARYRGDSVFSTEVVKNRSSRSSCSAPASSSATSTSSILYLPSLTSALFTVMSRSAPA
jgi:hypothetical protein